MTWIAFKVHIFISPNNQANIYTLKHIIYNATYQSITIYSNYAAKNMLQCMCNYRNASKYSNQKESRNDSFRVCAHVDNQNKTFTQKLQKPLEQARFFPGISQKEAEQLIYLKTM